MKKIKILFGILSILICGSFFHVAQASLLITEVMFDPEGTDTNREWVKVYNDGSEEITIVSGKTDSAWRFGDGPTGDTLHYINDTLVIGAGEYAVLASDKGTFISENSFSGQVADTSMSLSNTSGVVKLYDGSKPRKIIASKSYIKGSEEISQNDDGEEEDNDENSSSSNTSLKKEPFVFKISTQIIAPKIVVAGVPFTFDSLTKDNKGITYMVGKFVWNFGDGMSKELKKATPFDYYYDYTGEYIVNLYYYDNAFTLVPDAVSKITIKVVEPGIFVSSVGNYLDPYIEIASKSNYETDLSNWIVTTQSKEFTFPVGTTLLANKKIKLSPKITQFTEEDIKSIVISNPNKEIIVTYPENIRLTKSIKSSNTLKKEVLIPDDKEKLLLNNSEVINLNNLAASAGENSFSMSPSTYAFVGLALVILIGIISFLLAKNKNNDNIDSTIKAEDLSIIE